jgi:hypothetical protein
MSNPWETSNPWGKGSKEWNRWMAPEEGVVGNILPGKAQTSNGDRPLKGRKKATSDQKLKALELNDWYYKEYKHPSVFFEMVDRNQLAADIKRHVMNPNVVNQANTNLCGIAAVVQIFVEFEPKDFVEAVWELYFHGKATLYDYEVSASRLLGGLAPSMGLSPADYVLMSSIRLKENSLVGYHPTFDEGEGMTFPWEITKMVESLTSLRDVTAAVLHRVAWRADAADRTISNYDSLFNELNKFITADAKVIVLYDSGILNGDSGILGSSYTIYWHYVQFRKAWTDANETIFFDYWDYGNAAGAKQKVVPLELFQKALKKIWVFH